MEVDKWILFALYLTFSSGVQLASAENLNIVPTPESACRGEFTGEPCLTLQQYVANPSLSYNITLELQPGNHHLEAQVSAVNIDSLTIRAATEASVSCTLDGRFYFERLQNLEIRDITLDNCRVELQYVTNATFERSSFINFRKIHHRSAVYVSSPSGPVTNLIFKQCTLQNNLRSCCGHGGAVYVHRVNVNILNSNFTDNGVHSTYSSYHGGALYVLRGQVAISDSYFLNNRVGAVSNGGAAYVTGGGVTITDSYFHDNTAGSNGGAVYVTGGNITVSGSTFTNNTAIAAGGGAIFSNTRYANISLTDNTFSYNIAVYCGALDVDEFYHPHVDITANTFTHNRATGTLAGNNTGGVICIRNASIFFLCNNFSHNLAAGNGGVLTVDESDITVDQSVFDDNTAGDDGGVFHTYFYPTTYTITNSTFTNNQAGGDGGVMYVGRADSLATIHRSSFSSNRATYRGGVIAIVGSTLDLDGATFFENSADLGAVVSACNSNVTISNPNIDLVRPSCLLFWNLNLTVSTTSQTTTHNMTDEETVIFTTTVSLTEDDTTAEGDIFTTTAPTTEGNVNILLKGTQQFLQQKILLKETSSLR